MNVKNNDNFWSEKDVKFFEAQISDFEKMYQNEKEQFLKWLLVHNRETFYKMHADLLAIFSKLICADDLYDYSPLLDTMTNIHMLTGLKSDATTSAEALVYLLDYYSQLLDAWESLAKQIPQEPEESEEASMESIDLNDSDDIEDTPLLDDHVADQVTCWYILKKVIIWIRDWLGWHDHHVIDNVCF